MTSMPEQWSNGATEQCPQGAQDCVLEGVGLHHHLIFSVRQILHPNRIFCYNSNNSRERVDFKRMNTRKGLWAWSLGPGGID